MALYANHPGFRRGSDDAAVLKNIAALASASLATTGVTRLKGKIRADLIKALRKDDRVVTDIANDFAPRTDGQIRFYTFIEDLITPPLNKRVSLSPKVKEIGKIAAVIFSINLPEQLSRIYPSTPQP